VWLRTQRERTSGTPAQRTAERPKFRMTPAAWQACAFMLALQFQTASIYDFYPTLLKTVGGFGPTGVFAGIAAYSIGSVLGKLSCGWIATRFGERATILGCLAVTALAIVPFASAFNAWTLLASAMIIGASSSGVFALVPHYLSLRFANAVRSFGMGLAYALAAGGQAVATYVLPKSGESLGLAHAIILFVGVSTLATAVAAFWRPKLLPGRDMEEATR
jgi:SHS family lactate transporter-like MFS transporter